MASNLTVNLGGGKKQLIKTTPAMSLRQVVNTVCEKQDYPEPETYGLKALLFHFFSLILWLLGAGRTFWTFHCLSDMPTSRRGQSWSWPRSPRISQVRPTLTNPHTIHTYRHALHPFSFALSFYLRFNRPSIARSPHVFIHTCFVGGLLSPRCFCTYSTAVCVHDLNFGLLCFGSLLALVSMFFLFSLGCGQHTVTGNGSYVPVG
ncbi:MAG: hypothetical protein JOS17DRAFT_606979 [Linnemannia elongata]|nr:MAG: hypothetical protein JOS17DRAFT_606979 [Linnemannia elongata]